MPSYVVKAEIADTQAKTFKFVRIKTMYGGKRIAAGDEIFLFASETQGGPGLFARGVVTKAKPANPPSQSAGGGDRTTPRVTVEVRITARTKRKLGRDQLKAWRGNQDGSPEAELDFKFYRQATNKICGVSDETAAFLREW